MAANLIPPSTPSGLKPAMQTTIKMQPLPLNVVLHISALVGILAAFYAVDGVIGSTELSWTTALVAIAGTSFAMWYRRSGRSVVALSWVVGIVAGITVAAMTLGWLNLNQFMPDYSLQGDLSLAVIIQALTAIFTFAMVDDKRILMSSIVSMAMIGLVATYSVNTDLIVAFLVYMVSTTFLLLHQSFLMFSAWGHKSLTESQSNALMRTQLTFAVIGAFISLALGTVLMLPLQELGSHLSLAGALKGLATLAPATANTLPVDQVVNDDIDEDSSTFAIGLGPTSDNDSHTTLMTLRPSDGLEHYWRGRTYDHYTGTGWLSTLKDKFISPRGPIVEDEIAWYHFDSDPADSGIDPKHLSPMITVNVQVENFSSSTLYMPSNVRWIGVGEMPRFGCRLYDDGLVGMEDPLSDLAFHVGCRPCEASPLQLMRDKNSTYPEIVKDTYVYQRGDNINPADAVRFKATVDSIINSLPKSRRSEFYEANAIRDWVSARALYSLDVDPTPEGQDAVANFLYNTREGYCDLFASSMTLLCRYAGIPARVATGFDPGTRQFSGNFAVTSADKHAWSEVYFPGYGWQTFDPTAGTRLAPAKDKSFSLLKWLQSIGSSAFLFMQNGGGVPLALGVVLILAIALVVRNEVLPRLRPAVRTGSKGKKGTLNGASQTWEERSDTARLAALKRWDATKTRAVKWRSSQDVNETCLEYTRSLTSAISIAAQIKDNASTSPSYDSAQVIDAVNRLSRDFIRAKYANDMKSDEQLVERNEDGTAQRDLDIIFDASKSVVRSKVSAGSLGTNQFTYALRTLAEDPLTAPSSKALTLDSSAVDPSVP